MKLPSRDPSDWFSPMLVKEMRQGLKARTFVFVFLGIQLSMVISMFLALLPETPGESRTMSSSLFWMIATILIMFVMPLRGVTAITTELTERTLELVLLTRLSAWRIVTGKWASLVLQTLLITAALLPYLVLRYFLGGVDVVTEVLVLFMMLVASGWLASIAIFTSSYRSWIGRAVLVGLQIWTVGAAISILSNDFRGRIFDVAETRLAPILLVALVTVLLTVLVLELASGRIAPAAENHAVRKRGLGLLLLAVQLVTLPFDAAQPMLVVTSLVVALICIDALTEEVVETPSVYAPFVRLPVIGRLAGRFLYPGWPAGLWYSLALAGVLMTEILSVFEIGGTSGLIMALSAFGTLLFPAALHRTFRRGKVAAYYVVYLAVSVLLATLIAAVHSMGSPGSSGGVIGFVPFFTFATVAAQNVTPELELPFIVINGALVSHALFTLLLNGRAEWKTIRAQEAKAIALHVPSK